MDVHTKKQRSYNMSNIKGINTIPEIVIAKLLSDLHIPFISHSRELAGKPDFFIPSLKLIIEVYGCFWHAHDSCKFFKIPLTNKEFWSDKISSNKLRDRKNTGLLRKSGLKVVIVWECEIRNGRYFEHVLNQLIRAAQSLKIS